MQTFIAFLISVGQVIKLRLVRQKFVESKPLSRKDVELLFKKFLMVSYKYRQDQVEDICKTVNKVISIESMAYLFMETQPIGTHDSLLSEFGHADEEQRFDQLVIMICKYPLAEPQRSLRA